MFNTKEQQLIEQLNHKSSPKRRAAAKKIRKLKIKNACSPLLTSLKKEIKDKRTWETQYQIILALGESGCISSLYFLTQLAKNDFETTMILVALGDSITRLSLINKKHNINLFMQVTANNNPMYIQGALRAVALLKLQPKPSDIEKIISFGLSLKTDDETRVWIAAAAAGWKFPSVRKYLNECITSENQQVQRAAKAAINNRYLKWSPL